MAEQIKLSDELLMEIQSLRDELAQNVVRIGRLSVQASFYKKDLQIIENELESLLNEAEQISAREDGIQKKVIEQYGNGELNFETGIFTKQD
jgi:uncharacterized coiled-coil DUF342 family protein